MKPFGPLAAQAAADAFRSLPLRSIMRKLKAGSPFRRGVKPFAGKRARRPKSAGLKWTIGHRDGARALRRTRLALPITITVNNPSRYLHSSRTGR